MRLSDNEAIVSSSRFPNTYAGQTNQDELKLCREVVEAAIQAKPTLQDWSEEGRSNLKKFFALYANQAIALDEFIIEAYLYLFWESTLLPGISPPKGEIFFTKRGKVEYSDHTSPSLEHYKTAVDALVKQARVDLVAVETDLGVAYAIEMKKGTLDDRAIGQSLRYYRSITDAMFRLNRSVNLSAVRPVIFVEKVELVYWMGFPEYFRDLLEIYEFRKNPDSQLIEFHNPRKRLLSEMHELRRKPSYGGQALNEFR